MPCKPIHRFWRSAALPFVECRRAKDSAACYAPHSHAAISIGAVDGGSSLFSRDGKRERLVKGDVVLIPAHEVHACNPEDDGMWSYQMLYLDEAWVGGVVGEMGALDAVVLTHLPPGMAPRAMHARLTRLNACLFGATATADKEAALLVFVGDLLGPAKARVNPRPSVAAPLRRAKAMIESRCSEALSLAEIAAEAGMSRYHFVRMFSRSLGMTPHAWQLDLRIQRARKLLDQGMQLAEVALQLGFADQSHFQRAFKQRVAATPGEYRSNLLQD